MFIPFGLSKKTFVVLSLVSLVAGLFGYCQFRKKAYLTFEGRVLDQYGKPVPGARVVAAFPYLRKNGRGFRTVHHFDFTGEDGHYNFNSKPLKHNFAELHPGSGFDLEGNYYRTVSPHENATYRPGKGWLMGKGLAFDEEHGWHDKAEKDGQIIWRVNRNGGVVPVAGIHTQMKGDETGVRFCMNANDGKFHPDPNDVCDVAVRITPCPGGAAGNLVEVVGDPGGGVLRYDEKRMAEIEAPPGDYPAAVQSIDDRCPADYLPDVARFSHKTIYSSGFNLGFFFYSRNRQVYGIVKLSGLRTLAEVSEDKVSHFEWAEIGAAFNPRGERTLSGIPAIYIVTAGLTFPLSIPYHDDWEIDYSKIEVIVDDKKREITVRGQPGALGKTEGVWIDNFAPDTGEMARSENKRANNDGSFDLTIKADVLGAVLNIKFPARTSKHEDSSRNMFLPIVKLIKLTE